MLVVHWYDRSFPANAAFEQQLQSALQAAEPQHTEYYAEYLDTNKFPDDNQSELLAGYLRQKYRSVPIDVIVTRASPSLEFLIKHRKDLFPDTPIVFATERTVDAKTMAAHNATGLVYANSHAQTLDLALSLHPGTTKVFVVSGTLSKDRSLEAIARNHLRDYEEKLDISYLTDFNLADLIATLKTAPPTAIVLYVWQQLLTPQDTVLESRDVIRAISPRASVPIYGLSFANVGAGSVGGYVYTYEGLTRRLAQMVASIGRGARAADIPVEYAPSVPMFDWRLLQQWHIPEDRLPVGSVINYREFTFWQLYKWRVLGGAAVILFQAALIGGLLVQRKKSRRSDAELREYKNELENLVERRTAELVEVRDQALAATQAKTSFLARMSHELRTPLNAILGFSAIVRRDPDLSEQHRRDLTLVGSSGEHLLSLIDDVLDVAKIESGSVVVEKAPFDLHSMIHETVEMLRERAHARNLSICVNISQHVPRYVDSDPTKLRQILANLATNAIKYTDEGSVVVNVDASAGEHGRIQLMFDVEDTGIGIPVEDQARIFEPFIQTGPKTRTGVGLGLSITRNFVQLLGGTLHLESAVGKGSRFHVEIPVEVASPAPAPLTRYERIIGLEPGQPAYRILIVEDQAENWLLLERLLQSAGFEVRIARDGAQGVEEYWLWRPNFIWMDLGLPVMGGVEAARRIRAMDGGREVKIVALTASALKSRKEEAEAEGFDGFLAKPYRPDEIFDCMARHLGVRYIRKETRRAPLADVGVVDPAALAGLPAHLKRELGDAVVALDPQRVGAAIAGICRRSPSLGLTLSHLAGSFGYTAILTALEKSNALAGESNSILTDQDGDSSSAHQDKPRTPIYTDGDVEER